MAYVNNKALYYQQFLRRENGTRHHKYDEELQMYNMIRDGNMDAVKVAKNLFLSELSGHLSDTPLKNYKYLFIASITLATRFSIEGGMDEEDAYTASDLYIQRVDSCQDVDTVVRLYEDMIGFFTSHVSPFIPNRSLPVWIMSIITFMKNCHLKYFLLGSNFILTIWPDCSKKKPG